MWGNFDQYLFLILARNCLASTLDYIVMQTRKKLNVKRAIENNSRFSPVMWWKLKIVTIQWIKSRIWDTIDDWYINNLAKNQIFAAFYSRVICRSVSPKFIELCMETACLCPSEGHKYGGRKVTETPVTEFCYWNEKLWLKISDTLE